MKKGATEKECASAMNNGRKGISLCRVNDVWECQRECRREGGKALRSEEVIEARKGRKMNEKMGKRKKKTKGG